MDMDNSLKKSMYQPDGFELEVKEHTVQKLKNSPYGHQQRFR